MSHVNLKRNVKTAIFTIIVFLLVLTMIIDTRNRDNNNLIRIESLHSRSLETAVRIRDIVRVELKRAEDAIHQHSDQGRTNNASLNQTVSESDNVNLLFKLNENARLTLRFWDLSDNLSREVNKTKIFIDLNNLPSLWRPEKQQHLLRDEDRILAQLIYGMAAVTSVSYSNEIKMKTVYLPDSFDWWGKREWTSPHVLQDEECPGNPEIFRKCAFSENPDSDAIMDAMIIVRDKVHIDNFTVASHVLKFYFMLEPPFISSANLERSNDLQASFYRGSDVNAPYGKWVYYDPNVKFKIQEKDYAAGKSKMAAMFVSNCDTWNDRMGFVWELMKHISVDVYGYCGQLSCPQNNQAECFELLKRDYRFYLSFENSNCRDYVTEKLFVNAYENDIIPIVLGAHPDDYKAMCPEKSYIHVEDFSNPKELSSFMKFLADNPAEYNSYFRWKNTGRFIDTNFFCRICAMTHYADIIPPPDRKSSFSWSSDSAISNKMCLPAGVWYWNASMSQSDSDQISSSSSYHSNLNRIRHIKTVV